MGRETLPFCGLREPVSCGTHFLAFLWALYVTCFLWRLSRGERAKQWALGWFGGTMIAAYAASAAYHALALPRERLAFFQRLDHSTIYGLIAGTYTPVFVVFLRSGLRKTLSLGGMWLLAVTGIASKWSLPMPPYGLSICLYLAAGWVGLFPLLEVWRQVGWRAMRWILWGGVAYSLGGVADLCRWPILVRGVLGHHEVLHVCTMVGTFCHVGFMVLYAVPHVPPASAAVPTTLPLRRARAA
jgi:hemolysin III